jgi:hypothetical protein
MNLSCAAIERRARVSRARKAGTATVLPAVFDPAIGPAIGRWALAMDSALVRQPPLAALYAGS